MDRFLSQAHHVILSLCTPLPLHPQVDQKFQELPDQALL